MKAISEELWYIFVSILSIFGIGSLIALIIIILIRIYEYNPNINQEVICPEGTQINMVEIKRESVKVECGTNNRHRVKHHSF